MRVDVYNQRQPELRITSADFPRPPAQGEIMNMRGTKYRVQRVEWILTPRNTTTTASDVSMRVEVDEQQ